MVPDAAGRIMKLKDGTRPDSVGVEKHSNGLGDVINTKLYHSYAYRYPSS